MKFFRRKKFESDMETELGFHIDAYIEDLVRSGVDRREAQRRARVEFGAIEATKDECRQAWGLERLDELRADLRYTLRTLRHSPAFAAVAILALALGIGANTAIFGLVDAVMLRTLPVRDPGRLVFIQNVGTEGANGGPPYPCFELLRDRATSFESMAAFSPSNLEVGIDGHRELVRGVYVSGNFYNLLGVHALAGRPIAAADDLVVGKGGPQGPIAVISRAYWRQRFGGSPDTIGRSLQGGESPATIAGVMPSALMSLEPGRPVDVALPMMLSDPASLRNRGAWWLYVVARLKPGVRIERARAEADAIFQGYMAGIEISPAYRKLAFDHIELTPAGSGMDDLRTRFTRPLTALLVLAGLVLLAACVTVANLMLARATARRKEFAVRLALGAGRSRLVRQVLTEALVLSGAGCGLGLLLALRGEAALASFFAEGNNRIVLDLSLNGRLLLFTFAVSLLTGLGFGVLPALRALGEDPAAGLQGSSRSFTGSRRSLRLGHALVVLQVGLSMVLLAGAGLFAHSLKRLASVDLGFTHQDVVTMDVAPERQWFGTADWQAAQSAILAEAARLPGARSASWSTMTPLNGRDRGESLDVPGFTPGVETDRHVHLNTVSPEYFETFGIPLLAGRAFTGHDNGAAPKVAILNQEAARFYFGDANPIGRRIVFATISGKPSYEIAGVVKDIRHQGPRGQPWRFVYIPVLQPLLRNTRLTLSVRSGAAAPLVKLIQATNPGLLVSNISTIEKQVELSLMNEKLVSALSGAFGVLALALACIGLYGVLAYAVTRRTSELGIRMALGATGGRMVRMILWEALLLACGGIVLGIPPALALGRLSRALLFGVEAFDLPAFAIAMLVLLAFAAIAGLVPARRAGRLDPMSALRCE